MARTQQEEPTSHHPTTNPSMQKQERRVVVRKFLEEDWPTYKALRLSALSDSPDSFGSLYEEQTKRTDEQWIQRVSEGVQNCPATCLPLFAELHDEVNGEGGPQTTKPIGLAWGMIHNSEPSVANLYQLWVAPEYRGCGAGRMLVNEVLSWASCKEEVLHLDLGVTCSNTAAVKLYEGIGFLPVGDTEPLRPGSTILSQPMRLSFPRR